MLKCFTISGLELNPEKSENDPFAEELQRMQKTKALQTKIVSPVEELIDEMEAIERLQAKDVWEIIKMYPENILEVARVVSCLPGLKSLSSASFRHCCICGAPWRRISLMPYFSSALIGNNCFYPVLFCAD